MYKYVSQKMTINRLYLSMNCTCPIIPSPIQRTFIINEILSDRNHYRIKSKRMSYTWEHPNIPDFPRTVVVWELERMIEL